MTTSQTLLKTDQHLMFQGPTSFKTRRNQHQVNCGMCGKITYVDDDIFDFVADAIKAGLDSPFRCELCRVEYDDLAYEG